MVNSSCKKLICTILSVLMFLSIFTTMPIIADEVNAATSAPSGLKVNEYSNSAAKISWSKVSGATGYIIYRSTNGSSFSKLKTLSSSVTSYTNTGLASGSSYWYAIASYQTSNGKTSTSSRSSSVKVTTTTSSSVPTPKNFKIVEYSSNAIKLSWTKVSGVTGYYIYRSTNGSSYTKIKNITSASTTTYTNGGLSSGKKYYYMISSYKKLSNGTIAIGPKPSTAAKVATTSTTVTISGTTSTSTSIKLTWNKINNAAGYQILRLNNSTNTYSKIYTASDSTTSYTDKNLSSNTKYSYKIRAYYKVGTVIAYSPYTSVSAKTNIPALTGLSAVSPNYSSVTLKWTAAPGASGYQIYQLSSNNQYKLIATVASNSTSYTVESLSPTTTYTFKVRAYYKNSDSTTYSEFATIKVTTTASTQEVSMADEIFTLINAERKRAGIRLLQENDEITEVAQIRAVEISEKFGETRPNGKNWSTVLDDAGLYRWRYIGELRSHGFLSASSVVSDWMSDKASKNQILDEKVTDLGVGVYYKGSTPYYVAFFYRPLD